MIGHSQAGREPTPELALRPAPIPKFDGGLPGGIQPPAGPPPSAIQPQTSGNVIGRVPTLTPDKVAQYASLFEKSGAEDGILPGEQARVIFERAGLPNETLGKIWNLADTEQRGALTVTEFIIAMHLLASSKSGALRALPNALPAGLYEAAARRPPPSRQASGFPAGAPPAVPPIPRQFSGAAAGRNVSPLNRAMHTGGPMQPQQTGGAWAISPADKVRFDSIYATLDKTNRGFITGDEAVPFFSNSKLPEEVLAQIWDLADINSQGQLTKDEFAVAMYLIRQQRGKRDGRDTLPNQLPAELVPPSMRHQIRPPQHPTAPDFDAVQQQPIAKSAADDLFGLDAMASPAPSAPVQQPLSTGGSGFGADTFGSNKWPATPNSPGRPTTQPLTAQGTGFKPFIPSSSFGQTLTSQATGTSTASGSRGPTRASPMDDLLGDNDETSKKLTNDSAEIGNLQSQTGTLEKQVHGVQGQRANAQESLNQVQSQKRELEARLTQLRAAYENEAKEVRNINEQFQASRTETQKLQQEIAQVEGSQQELQNQHQQIMAALHADQQENASLKERIRELNAEITQLKPQLEKLRSDARQQKGLVAINKKQLQTNEGERDKLNTEATELKKGIEEDTRELAATPDITNQQHARAQAASPTPSNMSASNPFYRRQASSSDAPSSPFGALPPPQNPAPGNSFENIFGPTFEAAVHTELPPPTPMPQTSFKQPQDTNSRPTSPAVERSTFPQSDQTSTGFLPFPQASQSLSSSRQVSPPASRFGDSNASVDTERNALQATPTGSTSGDAREAEGAIVNRQINATTHTNERSMSDSMPGSFPGEISNSSGTGSAFGDSSDPFAASTEAPKPAAKDAFDSAFAGLGGQSQAEQKKADPFDRAQQEFPPLQEIDDDDDSTDSERGFDDDFAPSAGGHSGKQSRVDGATADKARDAPTTAPRAQGGVPPALEAQAAPPPYDKDVSSQERAHAEAAEFSGLLPTREDPTTSAVPNSIPSGTNGQASSAKATAQPVPPPKTAFDDFDEFDDLEDAKEGDLDDDLANLSVNERSSNKDDFNAVFDSTSASKAPAQGSGFGEFTASPTVTGSQQPVVGGAAPSAAPSDNDWDAIFAGLDNGSAPNGDNNKKALVDEAFGGPSTGTSSSAPKDAGRPPVGRALTEQGVHDDPILKNLTMMGYERKAALAALEKYDYNLERVSSFSRNIVNTS